MLLFFKLIDYLLAAIVVGAVVVLFYSSTNEQYVVIASVLLAVGVFLFLLNRGSVGYAEKLRKKAELAKKAELYTSLLNNNNSLDSQTVVPARAKALEYAQELIDDYKKARNLSRTIYYVLQISTVVLSGVTPILVLVDKLEAGQAWLKWLPVICPAVASIVASIVTSFPFQKNWVAANTAVELLEAEQEKFILGITPAYRCFDVADEAQQQQKISQAIEQFITEVNTIHLQQVQKSNESDDKKGKVPVEATEGGEKAKAAQPA